MAAPYPSVAHAMAHDAYDSLGDRHAEWVMATTDYHRVYGAPGA
ncbi:MAG TPA: hypothetical protein VLK84_27470 [Longimicrobium sp.]|nr:hypothetical protein [Longimicrobium sp.]